VRKLNSAAEKKVAEEKAARAMEAKRLDDEFMMGN